MRFEVTGEMKKTDAKEMQRKGQKTQEQTEGNTEKRLRAVNQTRESEIGQAQRRACVHTGDAGKGDGADGGTSEGR